MSCGTEMNLSFYTQAHVALYIMQFKLLQMRFAHISCQMQKLTPKFRWVQFGLEFNLRSKNSVFSSLCTLLVICCMTSWLSWFRITFRTVR